MKDVIKAHFDQILALSALVFIFVFGAAMLARYATGDELSRWIESAPVLAVIAQYLTKNARALWPDNPNQNPKEETQPKE